MANKHILENRYTMAGKGEARQLSDRTGDADLQGIDGREARGHHVE